MMLSEKTETALVQVSDALDSLSTDKNRAVFQNDEIVGYWQTVETLEFLSDLAKEIKHRKFTDARKESDRP